MLMLFKKFTFIAFFSVSALALIFTGCSKSNNGGPSGTTFTATVGTTAFAAGSLPGQIQAVYVSSQNYFDIGGMSIKSGDTSIVEITVPLETHTGIQLSSDTASVSISYSPNFGKTVYEAASGSGHAIITVTTQDTQNHKIAGTFSGVLYNLMNSSDSVAVTNGQFSSAYLVQ